MNTPALVKYLQSHRIVVLGHTDSEITVEAEYTVDGKAEARIETVPATMSAVRDWLGH